MKRLATLIVTVSLIALSLSLVLPLRRASGTVVGGEVFLQGNYVEVGIHQAGSFGTANNAPAGFHSKLGSSLGGPLGFVCDMQKDGWANGTPPQSGDYFLPGTPEEGWAVEWNGAGGAERNRGNFGRVGPIQIPTSSLTETSAGSTRSAVWEGTATAGAGTNENLKITQTIHFNVNDLFFVISTVMTNTGTVTLNSVEYMRNVDPDQEQPITGNFTTSNYVVAPNAANPNRRLVVGKGLNYGITLGLGTIDSRAKVSTEGFSNRDPDAIYDSPITPSPASPIVADQAIALAYRFGSLDPGQSVSFDYAYILNESDLEIALGNLGAVNILQPSGTVSGNNVIFQATTNNVPNTVQMQFYVNGVLVGTDTTPDAGGVFEQTFDSTLYANGTINLKVIATFSSGATLEKSSTASVDNSGPPVSFVVPVPGQVFNGSEIPIQIQVLDPAHPPVRVSFFRETASTGSISLGQDTSAPFESSFGVVGLPEGETVIIKAVAFDSLNRSTTIQVSGVTFTNRPPVASAGGPYSVNEGGSVPLSAAGSSDPDGDPLTYSWDLNGDGTPDASGRDVTFSASGLGGPSTRVVSVKVTDNHGLTSTAAATVTVNNVAPTANPDSYIVNEDVVLNTNSITGVLSNDNDPGPDVLIASVVANPAHGTLMLNANGSFSYAPALNYFGPDSFSYKTNDGTIDSNTATVSITINPVNDAPAAVCQNVTKNAVTCPASLTAAEVNNGSSDPDGDALTYSLSPAGPFSPGTTNVTLTATDPNGASSSCTASVTIIDNTRPTISCVSGRVASADASCRAIVPNMLGSASDNCTGSGSLTITQTPAAGTLVGVGTTPITITVTDAANNTSSCLTTFTVQDTTPPVLPSLPSSPQTFNWIKVNTTGSPSARIGHRMVYDPVRHKVILFGGADSSGYRNDVWELDTASNTWTEVTPAGGAMPIPRSYFGMAYDVARHKVVVYGGQVSSQYSNVNITGDTWEWDPAAHTWTLKPASSLVYVGLTGAAMAYDPTRHQVILFGGRAYWSWGEVNTYAWDGTNWTDITPAVYPPARSFHSMATDLARSKVVMFGGFNPNLLQDTWEWDGSSWTQVALSGPVPSRRSEPAMAYDSSRQVTTMFGGNVGGVGNSETWDWDGTNWKLSHPATSPSSRSTNMVYDSGQGKLVIFSGGNQADTWYSQTTSGLPTITGECSASVTAPTAMDSCAGPISGTTTDPTSYNTQGTYTVTWHYNDGNGNESTQTQTVIVDDVTAPVANVATLPTVTGECLASVTAPRATDNCAGAITGSTTDPTSYNAQGTYHVTWHYNDGNGNESTQTQTVVVKDTTAPVLNGVPADITVECDVVPPPATVTSSDNCDGSVTPQLTQKRVDGDCPSNYTLTRTWTATDHVGNSTSSSQIITVHDTTKPVFSTPPANRSANADDHCQVKLPDFTAGAVATDSCSTVAITQNPVAGTSMSLGHNPVRVTATDACGNATSVDVFFDVTDNTPPSITCPANITMVDNVAGSCGASVDPGTPATSDNCGIKSDVGVRSDNRVLTDLYPVGTTTITWTATDNSGNTSSCRQTVTVVNPGPAVNITAPTIPQAVNTPVNFIAMFADNAGDSHTAVWTFDGSPQPGAVDESLHTITATQTFTTLGFHTVSVTVTDDCGQKATANATILVYAPTPANGNGGFVIGDQNAAVGSQVTFWGPQWSKLNSLTGGPPPSSFEGFASNTSSQPSGCGGTWTTGPGNSPGPPESIPEYIGVIVSSSITKSGSTIAGNTRKMVVVKTNAGYDANPGHAGTGTVIAVICE